MGSTNKNTVLGLLVCGGLGAVLTACSGGGGSSGSASTTTTAATNTQTTTIPTAPISTAVTPAPSPSPVAVGTGLNSKFLFTCNFLSNDVSVYNVAATVGTLTSSVAAPLLTQSTATGGSTADPVWITGDATGSFVFVADSDTNAIDCFNVNRTTGALTPPAAPAMSAVPTGMTPYAVLVDPTSKFVYTANLGDNTVSAFQIQTGGVLVPCPTTPSIVCGNGASCLAMDPTGTFLYVGNTNDNTLSVLSIDALGNPTVVGAPIPTGNAPFEIATVNTGTGFVYVANNLDDTISVFSVGAAGALTPSATSPTVMLPNGGSGCSALAADPTGSFLYVVDGYGATQTNDISAFTISSTDGSLTPIGTTNVAAGVSPTAIAVDSSGTIVYVSDAGANAVLTFGITPGTGALIAEGTTPAGNAPTGIWASN